jgi:hypothetical protein
MKKSEAEVEQEQRERVAQVLVALETADARDAGLTLTEWQALTEAVRVKLWEDSQDAKFAADQGMTLADRRRQERIRREKGEEIPETYSGQPQWLRDQYARERPVAVAIEYLALLTKLETTTGTAQKEIIRKISQRTWRGWVIDRTVEEAGALLLEEIDRAGLREYFEEVKAQQAERADQ